MRVRVVVRRGGDDAQCTPGRKEDLAGAVDSLFVDDGAGLVNVGPGAGVYLAANRGDDPAEGEVNDLRRGAADTVRDARLVPARDECADLGIGYGDTENRPGG